MRVNIEQLDQGSAVYCQDLSLTVRVRIIKAASRVWRLSAEGWWEDRWSPIESIGIQKSQAQAFVHAGAFLLLQFAAAHQEDTAQAR